MQNKEETSTKNIKAIALTALIGGAISFAFCAIMLLIGAALVLKGWIPEGGMAALCIAACAASALIGGRFAARRGSSFPALCALGAGIAFCLLIILAALLINGGVQLSGSNLGAMAAALLGGGISGVVGTPKAKKKSKKRK